MHQSSFLAMEKFKDKYLDENSILDILDIGSFDSNEKPFNYGLLFDEKNWNYCGMDIREGPNVDLVVSDIYNWIEIDDESYDVVISGQVFEHMEYFWKAIVEIERILKPGGFCCVIAPSTGPVHRNPLPSCRTEAAALLSGVCRAGAVPDGLRPSGPRTPAGCCSSCDSHRARRCRYHRTSSCRTDPGNGNGR